MKEYIYNRIIVAFCYFFLITSAHGEPGEVSKVKLYNINDNKYISALEYADVQGIRTIFYEDKEKLEFRLQNYKLVCKITNLFAKLKISAMVSNFCYKSIEFLRK